MRGPGAELRSVGKEPLLPAIFITQGRLVKFVPSGCGPGGISPLSYTPPLEHSPAGTRMGIPGNENLEPADTDISWGVEQSSRRPRAYLGSGAKRLAGTAQRRQRFLRLPSRCLEAAGEIDKLKELIGSPVVSGPPLMLLYALGYIHSREGLFAERDHRLSASTRLGPLTGVAEDAAEKPAADDCLNAGALWRRKCNRHSPSVARKH